MTLTTEKKISKAIIFRFDTTLTTRCSIFILECVYSKVENDNFAR